MNTAHLIEKYRHNPALFQTVPELNFYYQEALSEKTHYIQNAGLCLILQGEKEITLGGEVFRYNSENFICYSMDLPVSAKITQASAARPYFSLTLDFDIALMAQVADGLPDFHKNTTEKNDIGLILRPLDAGLKDAFARLVGLVAAPDDIPTLAPLIKKEIYYRLLSGSDSPLYRNLINADSRTRRIRRAAGWLRKNYTQPFNVDALAAEVGMSSSSFYAHFRQITRMSPLQYQKTLRLTEARRFIRTGADSISDVARRVGYESPSQFSREYKRFFAVNPKEDFLADSL